MPSVSRHEVGPWPVISRLIGYGDRIWFANSVKGVNHNSADLHSVSLKGGAPRYEGHLFSQDAGDPLVHRGLLYWPLEDARTEPGIGAYDVTDGVRWEHGLIPTERAFHVHAMVAADDGIYAAPSAWKASIALSEDGGATWRTVYLHPTPDRRVSRITSLVALGENVYGALNAPDGRRLIRVDDGSGDPVPGWPVDRRYADLVAHRGALYGLAIDKRGAEIWRSDGERSERIWSARDDQAPAALASDGERLWMAGGAAGMAVLWSSADTRNWTEVATLGAGTIFDMAVHQGVVAVGGRGDGDRGVLWTIRQAPVIDAARIEPAWPSSFNSGLPGHPEHSDDGEFDWKAAASALDRLLADSEAYEGYGGRLRQAILELPRQGVPPDFFPKRLETVMPQEPLPMFGDILLDQMAIMGRWRLYWGLGLSRSGKVDPMDILRPWTYTPNRPFKYFSTPEMAIWAAGRLGGGADPLVLDALVARLE
ncbi:MAG: hypothetical protein ACR2P3_00915, partial [Geminicoccaceae bacterium]